MLRRARFIAAILAAITVVAAVPARADVVTDWNAIVIPIAGAGHPGPAALIDIAAIQAAVHDAVQAYEKRYEPYALPIHGASGSMIAAVATAAHDVLAARVPTQAAAADAAYTSYLAANGLAPDDPGVAVGRAAANAVLAKRAGDGSFPASFPAFTGGTAIGMWRPTPPGLLAMATPWAGAVEPYVIRDIARFPSESIPSLTSLEYAFNYLEVKLLGSATSTFRTAKQTHLARFYSDNFPAMMYRTVRVAADRYLTRTGDRARMLALAGLASADTFITIWAAKLDTVFWRPITAIHNGDADGNIFTLGDPAWQPFATTPNYPDFPSGANGVTAAMMRTMARVFGSDRVEFDITSQSALLQPGDPTTLTYKRFSDAMRDVVDVRVYQGIHWRFADAEGRRQGTAIADYVFEHALERQRGRRDD